MEQKRKINKEQTVTILREFWRFACTYRRDLIISLILIPLNVVLLFTIIPLLMSKIVEQLALGNSWETITPLLIFVAVTGIAGIIINYIGYEASFRHQANVYGSIVQTMFKTLSLRGEQFYANKFTGALTKHAIDFPNSYSMLEIVVINSIIPLLTRTISGIIIVVISGAPLVAGMLLVLALTTFWQIYQSRKARQKLRIARRDAQTDINSHLADVITNNQTMRTFANWGRESRSNEQLSKKWLGLMEQEFKLVNSMFNRVLQINLFMQVVFIALLVALVANGSVSVAIAIFCVTYVARFAADILSIGGIINQTENALIDAVPMMQILQEDPEVKDDQNASSLVITHGEVVFDDVTFAYSDNSDQTILPQLSLTIKSGEKIGLVGPSGGGKTTITKLLLRLLDIQQGSIAIDGQNISGVTQESLRNNIAYVPQEPLLFHRSLAENISYAKPNATKKQIIKAATDAHAHEFIQNLPQQYDTMVGERGVKLSGGQRQRVAIARAMLKDAPILILDEATSALDSENESLVQDALWKLMQNRTTIVIAHRLSTIQKMDRIIVLDEGKIAEEGSHKALLKKNGTYAKLWKHQSGGFLEE